MHVVLSGYFGFHNTGDEAILSAMIQQLREAQPDIRITVLSNDTVHTTQTYGVESVSRWSITAIVRVMKQADGLISGGGSLLQDATGPKSIIYYTSVIHIARWLHKPVYVFAQGMGPIQKLLGKLLTTYALNRVTTLTVRDDDSKLLLESIGVNRTIDIIPDPVLGMHVPETPSEWLRNQKIDQPVVTISVRDWKNAPTYSEKIAVTADRLAADGYRVVFVPMHGSSDEHFSETVVDKMKQDAVILPGDLSIEEKLKVIHESEMLLGMRLHSLIFAAISSTPFVPLSYDPKIVSFAHLYGEELVFHVEDDSWGESDLYNETKRIGQNREQIADRYHKITSTYQEALKRSAQESLNTFSK